MPVLGLNSNISALVTQRHLATATREIATSFTRLSSGLRINRASDDAAGLAIADTLKSDVRLMNQARRNVNDGISALGIISGTLDEQSNIPTRLVELAEQSANGTLANSQRSALNKEYQSLVDEFGRLGDTTKFNGLNLLLGNRPGQLSSLALQAGITGASTSQLAISTADTGTLSGTIDIARFTSLSPNGSKTFDQIATIQNNAIGLSSIVDQNGIQRDILIAPHLTLDLGVNKILGFYFYQRVSDTGGVGAQSGAGGAGTVANTTDEWVYAGSTGAFTIDSTTGALVGGSLSGSTTLQFDNRTVNGNLSYDFNGLDILNLSIAGGVDTAIDMTGVETSSRALSALTIAKNRIASLAAIRGDFGAIESRLNSTASLLAGGTENRSAAESQIRDADFAAESARLVAAQIKQQSAASVLRLANQQPSLVLQLLSGI